MRPLKSPLRLLFFDVGNVLLDETAWLARYHELAFEALLNRLPGLTREQFEAELGRGRARRDCTPMQHVFSALLPDAGDATQARQSYWQEAVTSYYALSAPAEGIHAVLDTLRTQFQLGIIANQLSAVYEWMERYSLTPYFAPIIYDCDIGYGKPDPRIFHYALREAGCRPHEAVMIGDRLDNDVAPARRLGFWTIRVRAFGDYTRFEPATQEEVPHVTIATVQELPAAVEEICRLASNRRNSRSGRE